MQRGANLLNNFYEPAVEEQTADQYLKYGVTRIGRSAHMDLSPAVAVSPNGIHLDATGTPTYKPRICECPDRKYGKFMSRARKNAQRVCCPRVLSAEQAEWAKEMPIAEDITAEADSEDTRIIAPL